MIIVDNVCLDGAFRAREMELANMPFLAVNHGEAPDLPFAHQSRHSLDINVYPLT